MSKFHGYKEVDPENNLLGQLLRTWSQLYQTELSVLGEPDMERAFLGSVKEVVAKFGVAEHERGLLNSIEGVDRNYLLDLFSRGILAITYAYFKDVILF